MNELLFSEMCKSQDGSFQSLNKMEGYTITEFLDCGENSGERLHGQKQFSVSFHK